MNKTDYAIALLIGFFVGIFAIPTAVNLGLRNIVLVLAIPWVGAVAIGAGVWIGAALARKISFLAQFSRFAAVGLLNTAIDFGILNLLSRASGITAGLIVGGVNLPGFVVAVFNSYFWNKLWVFKDRGPEPFFADFPKFIMVTGIGVLINSGIVIGLTTYVGSSIGLEGGLALNIAKMAATILTLIWNFVGYKFFVFRSQSQ